MTVAQVYLNQPEKGCHREDQTELPQGPGFLSGMGRRVGQRPEGGFGQGSC